MRSKIDQSLYTDPDMDDLMKFFKKQYFVRNQTLFRPNSQVLGAQRRCYNGSKQLQTESYHPEKIFALGTFSKRADQFLENPLWDRKSIYEILDKPARYKRFVENYKILRFCQEPNPI